MGVTRGWDGRREAVDITVDLVLRARGKMTKDKSNELVDVMVTEMLQESLLETVYEVAHLFRKTF